MTVEEDWRDYYEETGKVTEVKRGRRRSGSSTHHTQRRTETASERPTGVHIMKTGDPESRSRHFIPRTSVEISQFIGDTCVTFVADYVRLVGHS